MDDKKSHAKMWNDLLHKIIIRMMTTPHPHLKMLKREIILSRFLLFLLRTRRSNKWKREKYIYVGESEQKQITDVKVKSTLEFYTYGFKLVYWYYNYYTDLPIFTAKTSDTLMVGSFLGNSGENWFSFHGFCSGGRNFTITLKINLEKRVSLFVPFVIYFLFCPVEVYFRGQKKKKKKTTLI